MQNYDFKRALFKKNKQENHNNENRFIFKTAKDTNNGNLANGEECRYRQKLI